MVAETRIHTRLLMLLQVSVFCEPSFFVADIRLVSEEEHDLLMSV
jgi:hypothetical protein